jgi:hypothetical protein
MGKVAKVAVPIAIGVGIGFATGGLSFGATPLNFMGGLTSATSATTAGGFFSGSFFSGFGFNAQTLLTGVSFVSNIAGAASQRNEALLRQQEEQRRIRLARLNALQAEAAALKAQSGARGAAIAKAAAQGQNISGRSFLAFLDDQEREGRSQIDTIRVNAEAGIQTSQIRIRQFGSQASAAVISGFGSAARSLLV